MHITERLFDICYFVENQGKKTLREKKIKSNKTHKNILTD